MTTHEEFRQFWFWIKNIFVYRHWRFHISPSRSEIYIAMSRPAISWTCLISNLFKSTAEGRSLHIQHHDLDIMKFKGKFFLLIIELNSDLIHFMLLIQTSWLYVHLSTCISNLFKSTGEGRSVHIIYQHAFIYLTYFTPVLKEGLHHTLSWSGHTPVHHLLAVK